MASPSLTLMRHSTAVRACRLNLFGWTVTSVLSRDLETRDLDVVELWCGVGSVVRAALQRGQRAVGFDKIKSQAQDLTTKDGFEAALILVLRLVIGGLLWEAPVCSSFGFANSSRCKRNELNPYGDTNYGQVRQGNLMADIAMFFMTIAWARNVDVAIENPNSSWLFKLPHVESIGQALGCARQSANRCAYCDRPVGAKYWKPYTFLAVSCGNGAGGAQGARGAGGWIHGVDGKCSCPRAHGSKGKRLHTELMKSVRNGQGRTGIQDRMTESAAYPERLGEAIVLSWLGKTESARAVVNTPGLQAHESDGSNSDEIAESDEPGEEDEDPSCYPDQFEESKEPSQECQEPQEHEHDEEEPWEHEEPCHLVEVNSKTDNSLEPEPDDEDVDEEEPWEHEEPCDLVEVNSKTDNGSEPEPDEEDVVQEVAVGRDPDFEPPADEELGADSDGECYREPMPKKPRHDEDAALFSPRTR
jgi:hypothetical protein